MSRPDVDGIGGQIHTLEARLEACDLCPRQCGVDRSRGELGFCQTGERVPVAHIGLHQGEEPPISGTRGSGTIFFAHCNLRCVFCQNHQISQPVTPIGMDHFTPSELADEMVALQERGAHNVNLVSPTHVAAQVAAAIALAGQRGLSIPTVYNTNGYERIETLQALDGLIDVYLPDIKYSNDRMARRYSDAAGYAAVSRAAIGEMFRQVGNLVTDSEGLAVRGLLVRHLVLPADVAGSEASLTFLASLSKAMVVSLMAQYAPQHKASEMPLLDRPITVDEYQRVIDLALSLGLTRCYVQETEASHELVPDFERPRPFAGEEIGENVR